MGTYKVTDCDYCNKPIKEGTNYIQLYFRTLGVLGINGKTKISCTKCVNKELEVIKDGEY